MTRAESAEAELLKVREELGVWKHCANCHEPLQYPGYCQNAHGEEVQGLHLMLDETVIRATAAEAELSRLREGLRTRLEAMWRDGTIYKDPKWIDVVLASPTEEKVT